MAICIPFYKYTKHHFLNHWYYSNKLETLTLNAYHRFTDGHIDIQTDVHLDGDTDIQSDPDCIIIKNRYYSNIQILINN